MRHSVGETRGCHQSAVSGEATSRQLNEQNTKLSSWDILFPHCIGWFSKSSPSRVTSLEVNLEVLIPLFQVLLGSVVVDVQVLLLQFFLHHKNICIISIYQAPYQFSTFIIQFFFVNDIAQNKQRLPVLWTLANAIPLVSSKVTSQFLFISNN